MATLAIFEKQSLPYASAMVRLLSLTMESTTSEGRKAKSYFPRRDYISLYCLYDTRTLTFLWKPAHVHGFFAQKIRNRLIPCSTNQWRGLRVGHGPVVGDSPCDIF